MFIGIRFSKSSHIESLTGKSFASISEYPSETSCKQDLEIFEAVSKILSRSLKDNSFLYILVVSDTSVPKIFVRSTQRFSDIKIIEKSTSSNYLFPRSWVKWKATPLIYSNIQKFLDCL